jgi:hypothetical protein
MAQSILVNVYRINGTDLSAPQAMGFPSAGVVFRPVPSATSIGGVTMNSVIQLQPTGLNQPAHQHYVAQTVSALVTLANA